MYSIHKIQRQIPKEEPLLFCILPPKVDVRTMTNAQCNSSPWMPINEVEPDSICAADIGKGFCLNDAGGPLITNEGKFFSIIGKKIEYLQGWDIFAKDQTKLNFVTHL